jgi:hypothetical protein
VAAKEPNIAAKRFVRGEGRPKTDKYCLDF